MKDFKLFFIIILIFFDLPCAFGYTPKEGSVSGLVGPFLYKSDFTTSDTGAKSPTLGGFGLIVQGDVSDHSALEISLFHMNKVYLREQTNRFIMEETQLIHIAMGYRYWFNPYFSTAAAIYSAYSMGEPKTTHNDFSSISDIDTSARDTTEYGFDLSVESELWSQNNISIVVDGRYAASVTNKPNEKGNHYGIFIAWKFLVQEKQYAKK
ncbi:MAG: hypothetical protein WA160_07005 [Pseudobdellovibrio sp.]